MAVNYAQQLGLGQFDPVGRMQRGQKHAQDIAFNNQTMDMRDLQQQQIQGQIDKQQTVDDNIQGALDGNEQSMREVFKANPKLGQFFEQRQAQTIATKGAQQAEVIKDSTAKFLMALKNTPPEQRQPLLDKAIADDNIDFDDTDSQAQALSGNDQLIDFGLYGLMGDKAYEQFYGGGSGQDTPADYQSHKMLLDDLNNDDPNIRKAAEIKLRLKPGAMGSSLQTIANEGIVDEIAQTGATIEGAKAEAVETKKLQAQFKLSPQIAAAVVTATRAAKAEADRKDIQNTNDKAYAVYRAGMDGLATAMSNADTGVVAGTMFALSDDNKIASGTVAAMAPILKQMFRADGEGNFTDSDQKLLLDMIPTTSDSPKVSQAKLRNIDLIVNAKLGISDKEPQVKTVANQPQQPPQPQLLSIEDIDIDNASEAELDALIQQNGL